MHLSNHNALSNPYLFETFVKIDFDVKYFIHSHLSFESLSFHSSSHKDVRGIYSCCGTDYKLKKRSPVLKYIYQSEDIAYSYRKTFMNIKFTLKEIFRAYFRNKKRQKLKKKIIKYFL